jgi:hypothetical protein
MAAQAPTAEQSPPAEDITDAEVVEEEEPGQDLIVQESQSSLVSARIIQGATPAEVIEKATQIANAMKHLVEAQGFAVNMGGKKPHLEIAAWQSLGVLLGALGGEALHPEVIYSRPIGEKTTYHVHQVAKKWGGTKGARVVTETIESDYDVEGQDWESCVEVKTAAGVVVGREEGMCSRSELQWMQKPDPAVKSMASTRAASRAFRASLGWVVAIAGYNPTPAEEMPQPAAAPPAMAAPKWGRAAKPEQVEQARNALAYLLGCQPADNPVGFVLNLIEEGSAEKKEDRYLPHYALRTLVLAAKVIRDRRTQGDTSTPGDGDPAGETEDERAEREMAERIAAEAYEEAAQS